jgi:hypothetical protein
VQNRKGRQKRDVGKENHHTDVGWESEGKPRDRPEAHNGSGTSKQEQASNVPPRRFAGHTSISGMLDSSEYSSATR